MDAQLIGYLRWRESLPDLSALGRDEAWEAFRDAHGEACAVCRRNGVRLVVDHCHVSGWVRGAAVPELQQQGPLRRRAPRAAVVVAPGL